MRLTSITYRLSCNTEYLETLDESMKKVLHAALKICSVRNEIYAISVAIRFLVLVLDFGKLPYLLQADVSALTGL